MLAKNIFIKRFLASSPIRCIMRNSVERLMRSTVLTLLTHTVVYMEDCLCLRIDNCVPSATSSFSAF